jgi:hypothetical protein
MRVFDGAWVCAALKETQMKIKLVALLLLSLALTGCVVEPGGGYYGGRGYGDGGHGAYYGEHGGWGR